MVLVEVLKSFVCVLLPLDKKEEEVLTSAQQYDVLYLVYCALQVDFSYNNNF